METTNRNKPISKLHRAARIYAENYGMSVFPCVKRGKEPITAHGFKEATRNPEQINEWWSRYPGANIGVACGGVSGGLLVLDVDGDEGQESLRKLERDHGVITTAQTLTGKGTQYWFKSQQSFKNRVRLMPGIDIRSDGGYVIAPPSIHPLGKPYAWEVSARIDEVPLAPLPNWLIPLLSPQAQPSKTDWAKIAKTGAPQGARNQTLAQVAGHLFRRHVDAALAYTLLWSWNQSCSEQPLPQDEFDRTVGSIARRELDRRKGRQNG